MTLGVVLPILILSYFELKLTYRPQSNPQYENYERNMSEAIMKSDAEKMEENAENLRGSKILGLGIFFSGLMMMAISIFSSVGQILLMGIASIVIIIGVWIAAKRIIKKIIDVNR